MSNSHKPHLAVPTKRGSIYHIWQLNGHVKWQCSGLKHQYFVCLVAHSICQQIVLNLWFSRPRGYSKLWEFFWNLKVDSSLEYSTLRWAHQAWIKVILPTSLPYSMPIQPCILTSCKSSWLKHDMLMCPLPHCHVLFATLPSHTRRCQRPQWKGMSYLAGGTRQYSHWIFHLAGWIQCWWPYKPTPKWWAVSDCALFIMLCSYGKIRRGSFVSWKNSWCMFKILYHLDCLQYCRPHNSPPILDHRML